ncbi:MAG: hypothetical protein ACKOBV_10815, partial [Candidatus Kapaibacterium sp.]
DQIKAVAAGECQVAISNTYYVARLMRSEKAEDKKIMDKVGIVWPNQKTSGTHINISGGGVLKTAPHKENAELRRGRYNRPRPISLRGGPAFLDRGCGHAIERDSTDCMDSDAERPRGRRFTSRSDRVRAGRA